MPLSPLIRFGTSTWAYEGWQGQVYQRSYAKNRFAQECLEEYCRYQYRGEPLFRTVGNDSTFYRPPTAAQLRRYREQMPHGFDMCCKVWEAITIARYARHERYGTQAGQPNPRFLDAKVFQDQVLALYRAAQFEPYTGPFILEFQRHGLSSDEFCARLDAFFRQVPKAFRYAVELRNAGLLGPEYRQVLEAHGVAHVYNHWTAMPPLAAQHTRLGRFTAPFTVLRLLTPLGLSYERAKQQALPYTRIVQELPEMRRDAVELVRQALREGRHAYILVNNRAEGNAPLTIQALADRLRAEA